MIWAATAEPPCDSLVCFPKQSIPEVPLEEVPIPLEEPIQRSTNPAFARPPPLALPSK